MIKLKKETFEKINEVYENYVPEKADPYAFCLIWMNIIGEVDRHLNEHPKELEKIMKLLEDES